MARTVVNDTVVTYKEYVKRPIPGTGLKRVTKIYFFLDGVLHRKVRINRALDLIYCVKYPEYVMVAYPWRETRKKQRRAYTTTEVCALVNRGKRQLRLHIERGNIKPPHRAQRPGGKGWWYFFSEEDIMEIREFFAGVHYGRPRKDGMVTSFKVPPREQLRRDLGKTRTVYVKNDEGELVPVWLAEEY
jgi:hypothetical protein